MNYADHCHEQNMPPPKEPVVFSKFSSAIVGPYDNLRYPDVTEVYLYYTSKVEYNSHYFNILLKMAQF